ncbi:MAG: hypothetical protein KF796_10470 [Ramlibacter sp.]|nr:hypothetical protein [Ramlibacter sp.]
MEFDNASPLKSGHPFAGFCRAAGRCLVGVIASIGAVACGGGGGGTVDPPVALPAISAFTATPATIAPGQSSVLNWTTTFATSVTLDQVTVTGQQSTVVPAATRTYVLVASNSAGTVSATATVMVSRPVGLVADLAKVASGTIVSDLQTLQAPPVRLYFPRDNDGRGANNTFQIQFILSDGAWVLGSNPERALRLEDGVTGVVGSQVTNFRSFKGYEYRVIQAALSTDKRTLFFTVLGEQSAEALLLKPLITLNASTNTFNGVSGIDVTANAVQITGLKNLAASAGSGAKTLKVSYQHFTALTNPAFLATNVNAVPDQHTYPGQVLSGDLVTFVGNGQ